MKPRVLYSEANYPVIVRNKGYFIDKTEYVARLEKIANPVFLRPRRFGKTLLCSILRHYYDLNCADEFEELFSHTWIGQHPTGNQNSYIPRSAPSYPFPEYNFSYLLPKSLSRRI
ncbi:MAG: hypothetical protein D3911_16390 [Candidatus Electrothrix sp. AW3_4]|nr:hypothetical protein [Candidatus Electrothrix gigas]